MAKVSEDNLLRQRPHHLLLRTGIHFGPVLTDGQLVSGDSVNLAARVAATAEPGAVRITRAAFLELPSAPRLRCRPLPAVNLKGVSEPVDLLDYRWRDMALFPEAVRVEASGEVFTLPSLDVISFGRQRESEGVQANDVVINLADPRLHRLVSRWHFELRRGETGFLLRTVTDQVTEVDGVALPKGAEVAVRVGSTVRLGRDVVLTFLTPETESDETSGPGTLFIHDQGPEPA